MMNEIVIKFDPADTDIARKLSVIGEMLNGAYQHTHGLFEIVIDFHSVAFKGIDVTHVYRWWQDGTLLHDTSY